MFNKGNLSLPLKVLTWATAIIAALSISGIYVRIYRFVTTDDERFTISWQSIAFGVVVGFSLQIGLVLAPFVYSRKMLLRILATVLMIPFIYFILLHDLAEFGTQLIAADNFHLEDWKINFRSHIVTLVMTIICSVVYGVNIGYLLFKGTD